MLSNKRKGGYSFVRKEKFKSQKANLVLDSDSDKFDSWRRGEKNWDHDSDRKPSKDQSFSLSDQSSSKHIDETKLQNKFLLTSGEWVKDTWEIKSLTKAALE